MVDQVDDVVAAAACALADAGPRDGDGEMGLAGAGAADQDDVALALQEAAAGELLDQGLVDRRGGEVEVGQLLGLDRIADLPQTRLHELLPWHWKADRQQALAA